jgi:hypothetical protein
MLAAAMPVLLVTLTAGRLGALLRGMVFGYFAFATFCLIVSVLLRVQPKAHGSRLARLPRVGYFAL